MNAREAPERVEIALRAAFRRHHRVRRLRRTVFATISMAAAACVISFVQVPPPVGPPRPVVVQIAPPQIAWVPSRNRPEGYSTRRAPTHKAVAAAQFVPLPFGDQSLINESATIVRVELPRSALRLAGFNVAQERANDRIEADVLLGPDGLAHAVRFLDY